MKTLIKFIIVFLFIIIYQNSYSKPIPPGSGAGDVPANILFLLDNSASMDDTITADNQAVGQANDVVELSDGNLIIATTTYGIVKVNSVLMELKILHLLALVSLKVTWLLFVMVKFPE